MVRNIKLNDGKSIPAVAWGNGTGGLSAAGKKAVDTGALALREGIRHIDTAQSYRTEEETGLAIKAAGADRKAVFQQQHPDHPEGIKSSVTDSISKLGFIPDLLLIHSPFVPAHGKIAVFWQILESLVEDGTLKGASLGVSNFRPQDLEEVLKIAKIKPVVNLQSFPEFSSPGLHLKELEYHPYVLNHLDPVLAIQAKHGIVSESYGPLTPLLRHPTGGPLKPVLQRIAQRLSKDTGKPVDDATVLLLWTVQKGVVAVTTSGNPDNIKKLVEVDSLPDLTDAELKEIEEVGRKVHFRHYKEHMTKDFPEPDLPQDV
ncbi:hypothetical protein EHS25_008378 [Saitozyma podzolica]|uniref:NADP-dependent oxidoreductase domain-containing protein n=1 Tax=Saitozyma podzolica TaxID=1890683 RepID=A0A427YP97_9TREE|nr:hypothetical protein EHS25_008378 [Saitozyma podzolica]